MLIDDFKQPDRQSSDSKAKAKMPNVDNFNDETSGLDLSKVSQNRPMANPTGQRQFQKYYSPYGDEINKSRTPLKPPKPKWSRKKKIGLPLLIILIAVLGVGIYFGTGIINSIDKVFHGNLFSDVKALFSTTELRGQSSGRINILLAGYQGSQSDEGPLTDSIMVVSLDPVNHTGFTYSIPRDLWVNVPGTGNEKINAANTNSSFKQSGYFSGGMGQLQQVVEQDIGIPIDYYALIDYTAFEDAVNAVGGITVNIQSPDPRGLYDPNVDKAHGGPLKLPNGSVHLNGLTALALALARGDSPYSYGFPLSDINRTQHQRQMLIALEQKASTLGILSNPVTITNLLNSISNNVRTNLSLSDVLALAHLAKGISQSDIQSYGLNYGDTNPLLASYIAPDGEDALAPRAGPNNFSQIKSYYKQITSNNPVTRESATIVLINGSGDNSMGQTELSALKAKGADYVTTSNAYNKYSSTLIINFSNNQDANTLKLLQQMFPGSTVTSDTGSVEATEAQAYTGYNFVVVLGHSL